MELFYIDDSKHDIFFLTYQAKNQTAIDTITTFLTGGEAVAALRQRIDRREALPDAIVIDLYMPGSDGCDVLREIAEMEGSGGILLGVCSGSSSEFDHDRAMQAGAAAFFDKPLDLALVATRCA